MLTYFVWNIDINHLKTWLIFRKILKYFLQFNKEGGRILEECKLRVVYTSPSMVQRNLEDDPLRNSMRSPTHSSDGNTVSCSIK